MTKKRHTKRALLASILSMMLCATMLIGSTFAWFTDTATTGTNKIVAGNLDVKLEYSKDMKDWKDAETAKDVFSANKWEPGYTEVVYFRVVNDGDLAIDYQVMTNIVKEIDGINVEGKDFKLSEYLQFGIVETTGAYADRAAAKEAIKSPSKFSNVANGEATLAKDETATFAMVVWMPETIGNEANHNGKDEPVIQFGVQVLARQATVEEDSFGKDYDANATYPQGPKLDEIVATPGTVEELRAVLETALTGGSATGTITINLEQDFDAENEWTAVSPKGYAGVNKVVINGNGHKISNLNEPFMVGSFAGDGSITVNDLVIEKAEISHERYNNLGLGAIIAYSDASGGVILNGCEVVESTIECTNGYAGGLIGYTSTPATITDCSVTKSIIKGGNSTGGIIGQFAAAATVSECTISDNTISYENGGDVNQDAWRVGVVVGTANVGIVTMTNITENNNELSQGNVEAPEHSNLYGRSLGQGITLNGTKI